MPQRPPTATRSALREFLRSEAAGGILLMGAAALALLVANSPLQELYHHALHDPISPALAPAIGPMTAHLWINDGLMAIFFLLVGLEIKRELVDGRLATWSQRRLPFIAAASGMVVPAAIYLAVTFGQAGLASGWAIPAATDIAFAIGVLALLGKRAPTSLKLFLTTVAIVDDMGAVAIIALAYAAGLLFGKQIGIFGAVWLSARLGIATRLRGASWLQIYGVSLLCGIGFTMSLFIGALAFPAAPALIEEAKLGVLLGSFCSAIAGYLILRFAPLTEIHAVEQEAQETEISADGDVSRL